MDNLKILEITSIDQAIKTCQQNPYYHIMIVPATVESFNHYAQILKQKLTFTHNYISKNNLTCIFNNGSSLFLDLFPCGQRVHQIYYELGISEDTIRYILAPCAVKIINNNK